MTNIMFTWSYALKMEGMLEKWYLYLRLIKWIGILWTSAALLMLA